ncbi:hypothetical protein [Paraburkholderia sp. A3RO-2L]|uniref:hypothetical protein n=1 Tax=Paraburkholderia sp. A3RO-2L TaxID=3028376 RepID=UPI0032F620B2|nr:hypothetical protein [Burkholderia vietnamiensis]
MHACVYREFEFAVAPNTEIVEVAPGVVKPEHFLYVKLAHRESGVDAVFRMRDTGLSPERLIEEQIIQRFPDSDAAHTLRALHGLRLYRLKPGWDKTLGDRIFAALSERADSRATRYWAAMIPTLPAQLYSTMTARAVAKLRKLPRELEERAAIRAVHDAWLNVLMEARHIGMSMNGLERLALDINGWKTEHLRGMSVFEYGKFKDKALFALLALGYLQQQDWSAMLATTLELIDTPTHHTDILGAEHV